MNKENHTMLSLDDVYFVGKNQKGVMYLVGYHEDEIVAKKCTKCDTWHFLDGFNKAGKGFAGSMSYCRDCHNQRDREAREAARIEKQLQEELQGIVTDEMIMLRKTWF